jgi:hypothetical protein
MMADLPTCLINWWIPHWRLETRRVAQEGSYVVAVPGLSGTSFYIPSLVLRQFGMEQTPLRDWDNIDSLDIGPLMMENSDVRAYLARAWTFGAFPPVVLIRRLEHVYLTTEYLDWYDANMGETQGILLNRREEILGQGGPTSRDSRNEEAWANPHNRTGDDMADYGSRADRLALMGPEEVARRRGARNEARANSALQAAGLVGDMGRVPEIGRRDSDMTDVPRRTVRRRRGKGKDGEGTSGGN